MLFKLLEQQKVPVCIFCGRFQAGVCGHVTRPLFTGYRNASIFPGLKKRTRYQFIAQEDQIDFTCTETRGRHKSDAAVVLKPSIEIQTSPSPSSRLNLLAFFAFTFLKTNMNFAIHLQNSPVNGAAPPAEDDDAESDHDSVDSLSSMSSEEIESHFVVNHNRRFHSHGNGGTRPYPFPVDELETEVRFSLYLVEEMAAEFHSAKVYGLDIVPMATRYPADNVQFEIHDINERTRWADGRFELVHMRNVYLAVPNYPMIVREIARLLCPQGLFFSGEWSYTICAANGSEAPELAPGASQFIQHVVTLVTRRSSPAVPHTLPTQIRGVLQGSGYFGQIVRERHIVALDDSERGRNAKLMLLNFGDSARGFLLDSGLSVEQVGELFEGLRSDLDNNAGINLMYLTVHARRNAVHWQST
ncbi:hypothetical protein EW145_g6079 [Phellinidium pouzarii]|uniref:Methyltransferase domain-containing protein n=1 Tax=Phellinidium pouzarii TaxID=167371 RepID=A0A4S4KXU6_9AGAM|nr:hypothetical protein EW145_g6079 [Phellinidium pouzarii]